MNKPTPTRVIGLDYGQARIGVAYSDERKIIASPLMTIQTEKKLDQTVIKLLGELEKHQKEHRYTIELFVVGLPLMMNGTHGLLADEVKQFINLIQEHSSIPIKPWDERLTSVQAERSLRESTMTRKARTKHVDQVSAAIILQSYLDLRASLPGFNI